MNDRKNSRTGLSPRRLFEQFKRGCTDWCERRRNVNETDTKFEPLQDTLVKMKLLDKSTQLRGTHRRRLTKEMRKRKRNNKNHEWNNIKLGSKVFLTKARLKGYPTEKPLKIFEKKSTQLSSEWETGKPYRVARIIGGKQNKAFNRPKRYQLQNVNTGVLRKTLYYREELLKSKTLYIYRQIKHKFILQLIASEDG